jgi:hypothetical protein
MKKNASSRKKSSARKTRAQSAARLTKQLAAKQKIRIDLTQEQLRAITDQWTIKKPGSPAEISFHVGERKAATLKVASYSYWGDTCCV